MNELNYIWQDVHRGPPDPFLVLLINTDNVIFFFMDKVIFIHKLMKRKLTNQSKRLTDVNVHIQ